MTISNGTFLNDHKTTRKGKIDKTSSNTWIFLLSGYKLLCHGVGHVSWLVRYRTGAQTAVNSTYSLLSYGDFSCLNTTCLFTFSTCFLSHMCSSMSPHLSVSLSLVFRLQQKVNFRSLSVKPSQKGRNQTKSVQSVLDLKNDGPFSSSSVTSVLLQEGNRPRGGKFVESVVVKFRTSENHKMMHLCYL